MCNFGLSECNIRLSKLYAVLAFLSAIGLKVLIQLHIMKMSQLFRVIHIK